MTRFFAILTLLLVCFCNGQNRLSEVLSYKDLVYKSKDSVQQKLDIYLPKNTTKKNPVLIFVHGGGWVEGDKSFPEKTYPNNFVLNFVKNGYAVVSIDYTLVSKTAHFPTPIEDCKTAVRWLRSQANVYNLDVDNFGIWGASAGGQLALLIGYSKDNQLSENDGLSNYSSKVNYVIDYFGPTEMNQLFRTKLSGFVTFFVKLFISKLYKVRNQLVFAITGKSIKDNKKAVISQLDEYSPLNYVDQYSVPTLMIHGTKDKVVPINQSYLLQDRLNYYKVENELISIPNGNHGLNDVPEHDMMMQKTLDFMKNHTK